MSSAVAEMFASGRAVDLVLAVMALEAIWLIARRGDAGAVLLALAPGALILLAVRAALTGAGWQWVALLLTASLPAHLADLARRGWLRRQ